MIKLSEWTNSNTCMQLHYGCICYNSFDWSIAIQCNVVSYYFILLIGKVSLSFEISDWSIVYTIQYELL